MAYTIENGCWGSVFAVPSVVVDEHLKLSGAASLKALLILLRRGGSVEPRELSETLGLSMADVQDAMNYWVHLGIVRDSGSSAPTHSAPVPQYEEAVVPAMPDDPPSEAEDPQTDKGGRPKPGASRRRISTRQINEMSAGDENIAYLLQEAQSVMGQPLTKVATETVAALYTYYGMRPDLVLMLLQYCVSIGKDSMRYIEKVAAGWIEQGIDTHEKAEAEILRATRQDDIEHGIKKLLGIHDRALISSEREYIRVWTEDYGFSSDLIGLAYERTIELKAKLSFPYINGILSNWHSKGIKTPAAAFAEIKQKGKAPPPAAQRGDASYDMGELERLVKYGEPE